MITLLRHYSLTYARQNWGRTLLIISGIAVGIALMVAMSLITQAVVANFRHNLETLGGPADLEITLGLGELGFSDDVFEVVRADENVASAVALVGGAVSLVEDPAIALQVFGTDLLGNEDMSAYDFSYDIDRALALEWIGDPHSILITERFAQERALTKGSTIELSTPTGIATFKVQAVLKASGLATAFGGRVVVMDIFAAQAALGKNRIIDQIDVTLRDGVNPEAATAELAAKIPSSLSVRLPGGRATLYEGVLATFQAMLLGVSSLCLIAGFYIIYNTTSTGAAHRSSVIANMRLIGAHRRLVVAILTIEAAILGTLGAIAGIAIGVILALLITPMVTQSMGVIFQLRFGAESLAFDLGHLYQFLLLGIGAAMLSSSFSAYRLARVEPIEAVQETLEKEQLLASPRTLVLIWIALVAVSIGALVIQHLYQSVAWGNFGATLWNASILVIAIPLLHSTVSALLRRIPENTAPALVFALQSIHRAPVRTGITTSAIALAVIIGVLASSLATSFRLSMNSYLGEYLRADLAVSAASTFGGWLETPIPSGLADKIESIPGVERIDRIRVFSGQLYEDMRIGVAGLSPAFFAPSRFPDGWYKQGDAVSAQPLLLSGEGANISTALADRTRLQVGDTISLTTPTGSTSFKITGIVPDYVSDRGTVLIEIDTFKHHWQLDDLSRIHVQAAPDANIHELRDKIVAAVGGQHQLKVLTLREVFEYHDDKINSAFAFTAALQLLLCIVTVAGIFDLLVSRIVERRHELAVWQLVGAPSDLVRRSIVLESVMIGAFGAVMGIAAGLVTSWIWVMFNFRYLLGYYLEFHFASATALWYVTIVLMTTMGAGYAAAHVAYNRDLVERLRTS
jgi:putative ABC transport system permease protein